MTTTRLIYSDDGRARVVSADEWATQLLPQLLDDLDAQAGPDALDALVGLGHTAVDVGAFDGARLVQERLATRAAQNTDPTLVAALHSAQFRLGAAVAAGLEARQPPLSPKDVAISPLTGPLWAAALKDAASLVPQPPAGAPRVVVFAFADTTSVPGLADPEAPTARLARGAALVLAEQLGAALPVTSTAALPLVRARGLFVAQKAWDLVTLLALSPRNPAPRVIVSGVVHAAAGGALRVSVTVHDVESGRPPRVLEGPAHDGDLLGAVRNAVASAVAACVGVEAPTLTPRGDGALVAAHNLHALLLAATGHIEAQRVWSHAAALDSLLEQLTVDDTPASTLSLLAGVACASALHVAVAPATQAALSSALSRHADALGPVQAQAQRLLAALSA